MTELIWRGEEDSTSPIENGRRQNSTHIHFIDEQYGWLIGYTGMWWERRGDDNIQPPGSNFLCSTRDGGDSWNCEVHPYPWLALKGHGHFRIPVDIDFINRQTGWIAPSEAWMYRTTDGGVTWEWTSYRHQKSPDTEIEHIDFLDESRGWAVGSRDWFTGDGGNTWTRQLPGWSYAAPFADGNDVWIADSDIMPDDGWRTRIYRSGDDGESWQLEWEGPRYLTYVGYHEVTQTLWAGEGTV